MTHTCKVCSATENTAEFYKGVTNKCKECHKELVRQNRKKNAEYYREYDKYRFKNDPKVRERHKRYQKTDAGKASIRRAHLKYWAENPEKRAATNILNSALKRGKVIKPSNCQECGSTGRIEGHHTDYTLPLNVEWLCNKCHRNRHKQA